MSAGMTSVDLRSRRARVPPVPTEIALVARTERDQAVAWLAVFKGPMASTEVVGLSRSSPTAVTGRASTAPRTDTTGASMSRIADVFSRLTFTQTRSRTLAGDGLFAIFARVSPGLSTFAISVLVGRLGGVEMLGEVQLALSSATLACIFFPTPAGSVASRFLARSLALDHSSSAEAVTHFVARSAGIAAVVLAGVVMAIHALAMSSNAALTISAGLMTLAVAGRAVAEGFHAGLGRLGRLSTWTLCISSLGVVGAAAVLVGGGRSATVLVPLALGNLFMAYQSLPIRRSFPRETRLLPKAEESEILKYVKLGITGMLASTGLAQGAIFAASISNDLSYVGQYSAAMTLTMPFALAASAMILILFPALSKAHATGSKAELRRLTDSATRQLSLVLIAGGLLISPIIPWIVEILWGTSFKGASFIACFLLVSVIVNGISAPSVSTLTTASSRGMSISSAYSWMGFVVAIISWILLSHQGISQATPIAYAIGTLAIGLLPIIHVWKQLLMRWSWLSLKIIAASLVMILGGLFSALNQVPLPAMIAMAIVSVLFWLAVNLADFRQAVGLLLRRRVDPL